MINDSLNTLQRRLRDNLRGEVLFDAFSRGRYSSDASIYQLMPLGVVIPSRDEDVEVTVQLASEYGVPVLPRGGGTSQNGQTVGEALVLDTTRHLNQLLAFDPKGRTACVQPGIVLDHLNRFLKAHGLFYPVDVSTANRATIGGMTGRMAASELLGTSWSEPPDDTAHGALLRHLTVGAMSDSFQPMNVNFGLFPPLEMITGEGRKSRKLRGQERKAAYAGRALLSLARWANVSLPESLDHTA